MGKLGRVITLSSYVATACGGMPMSAGCQTPGRFAPIWAGLPRDSLRGQQWGTAVTERGATAIGCSGAGFDHA